MVKYLSLKHLNKNSNRKFSGSRKEGEKGRERKERSVSVDILASTYKSLQFAIFMKNNGLTPLHMASGTGKYEVCKILVKA